MLKLSSAIDVAFFLSMSPSVVNLSVNFFLFSTGGKFSVNRFSFCYSVFR